MRRRDPKIDAAWLDYQAGLSLEQIAQKLGVTRQSVFCGFKRRGYQLRQPTLRPCIMILGKKFTLRKNGDHYRSTTSERATAQKYVWEKENGRKLPTGWCVVHVDCDVSNNDISNLECVPRQESGKYARKNNQHTRGRAHQLVNNFCINCGKRITKGCPSYRKERRFCSTVCRGEFIRGCPKSMKIDEISQYKSQIKAERLIFAKGQSPWQSDCRRYPANAAGSTTASDIVKNQRMEA